MINLLPPKEKERIRAVKKAKITAIFGFLFLFLVIYLFLIFLSVHLYFKGELESQDIVVDNLRARIENSEIMNLEKKFSLFNKNNQKINSFYSQKISFSGTVSKITRLMPEDAYLNSISISLQNKQCQVSVSGFIKTRESLFDFKKTLEKESGFKNIVFPPANWVSPKDIDFSVTFKI